MLGTIDEKQSDLLCWRCFAKRQNELLTENAGSPGTPGPAPTPNPVARLPFNTAGFNSMYVKVLSYLTYHWYARKYEATTAYSLTAFTTLFTTVRHGRTCNCTNSFVLIWQSKCLLGVLLCIFYAGADQTLFACLFIIIRLSHCNQSRPSSYMPFTSDPFLQLFLHPGTRPYPSPLEPPWLTLIGGEKLHQLSNKEMIKSCSSFVAGPTTVGWAWVTCPRCPPPASRWSSNNLHQACFTRNKLNFTKARWC